MSDIIEDIYKLDCRKLDITKKLHKETIDEYIKYCTDLAYNEKVASNIFLVWQKCEMYYEGWQSPISNTAMKEWVKNNWMSNRIDTTKFYVKKSERNQIYHVDNKITDVVDGFISEYSKAEKTLTVDNDGDPKYDNIAKVIKRYIGKMENKTDKQVWTMTRLPSIENFALYGLGWDKIDFNHRINTPYGDLEYEYIHPRNVDVDPNCELKYFQDARFLSRRRKLELNEAREYVKRLGKDPKLVVPDSDYEMTEVRRMMKNNQIDTQNWVTFYEFYYRKIYTDKNKIYKEPKIMMLDDTEFEEDNIYYFNAIWNKTLGTLQHWTSPYVDPRNHKIWQFNLFPYCGRFSRVRLYPVSIVERLLNLQDIINITESLILDNARQKQVVRMIIHSALLKAEGPSFTKKLREGGLIPVDMPLGFENAKLSDLFTEIKVADLPASIEKFLELALNSIKEQGIRQEPLQGKVPEKGGNLSGVAISKMQRANRQMLSGYDTNIEWTVTQEGNFVYKVIATEYKEEQWIRIQDKKKDEPGYIPMCTYFDVKGYAEYLKTVYPNDDFKTAGMKFAKYNDVNIDYQIEDKSGRKYTVEEAQNMTIIYVNYLTKKNGEKFDLDIKVMINFEAENDRMETLAMAESDLHNGNITIDMVHQLRKGWFESHSDEILEKVEAHNQVMQIGKEVVDGGPELVQAVQQFIGQFAAQQEQKKKIEAGVQSAQNRQQVKQLTEPKDKAA